MIGTSTANNSAASGAPFTRQSLRVTMWAGGAFALAVSLVLVALHQLPAAWAFAGGSLVSLFSAGSLTLAVPFALRGRSHRRTRRVLLAVLIAKVPIFVLVLSVAAAHAGGALPWIAPGIGVVPLVLTVGALVQAARSAIAQRASADLRRLAAAAAGMQFTAEYHGESEGR